MIDASYVVIRFVADTARNEPTNVGILAWTRDLHELAIDRDAVARIVRDNPRLHPDALLGLDEILQDHLGLQDAMPDSELRERLGDQPGLPLAWTEPRFTSIANDDPAALHATVERLVGRVVKPRRRPGGGGADMLDLLERRLKPLIASGKVHQNHVFHQTRTGVERRVDLFANSTNNTAVDWLKLDLRRASEIRLRADAEANKLADILERNDIQVLVLAAFSEDEDLQPVNIEARQILAASSAMIVETIEAAAKVLESSRPERKG